MYEIDLIHQGGTKQVKLFDYINIPLTSIATIIIVL